MKYIITERQSNLIEQKKWYEKPGFEQYAPTDYEKRELKKAETTINNMDPHTLMTVAQIGTAFIPLVGPLISMGIGLADAKLYYDEGDKKTAGLIGLFSMLPGVGGLASKLGLSKWSVKALGEIGKKISLGSKLTSSEIQVVNRVVQYKQVIQNEMNKIGGKVTNKVGKNIASNAKEGGKQIAKMGATGAAYSKTYDVIQKDTPKAKAAEEKLDWNFVRDSFGSSGTAEDNKLLNQAWNSGWRPGMIVPEKFQLKKYKENYAQDEENAKKLKELVVSLKK
jgi:hypothetical protein